MAIPKTTSGRVTRSTTKAAGSNSSTPAPRRSLRRLRSELSDFGSGSEESKKRQRIKKESDQGNNNDNQSLKKVKQETTTKTPVVIQPQDQVLSSPTPSPAVVVKKERAQSVAAAGAAAVVKPREQEQKSTARNKITHDRKGKGRMTITTNANGSSSASTPSLFYSGNESNGSVNDDSDSCASETATPSELYMTAEGNSPQEQEEETEEEENDDGVIVLSSVSDAETSVVDLTSDEDDSSVSSDDEDEDEDEDDEAATHNRARRTARGRNRGRGVPRVFMTHAQRTNMKLLKYHPELKDVWEELEATITNEPEPIEQPAELKLPLLPFQKLGVGWMRQQEELNDFKGGVLADEMGMGKTIQTIALLLSDKQKPNLVVAPTVAIMQWKQEIEQHTSKALKVVIFHGAKRNFTLKQLQAVDVVLTTYSLIENEFRKQEVGRKVMGNLVKEKSILHQIHWHRIILDEAHNIKDRSSNTARACFNLDANYRWSLTGTPLQNRVGELYSLIRFMQADPFAYYYCKSCDCKKINWEFSDKRGCDSCGHTPMDHVCWWNNEVLKPIQNHGNIGPGRDAMGKLRKLLDKMMLRRTKIECADDLGLPPRVVEVRRDMFNEEEEDVYTSLYTDTARQFTTYVEDGSVLNNYANIFELLTRMRLCANHPDLVTKKLGMAGNKQLVCMLCSEPPEDAIRAACRHVFCRECCNQYLQSFDAMATSQKPKCPTCFANFSVDLSQPPLELEEGTGTHTSFSKSSIVNRINMDKWRSSTKIEALTEELYNLRSDDRTIKSIVFSQFVNFLDLIYWRLSRAGFECIRLDGTMSPQQRDAAIQHFNTKPSCTVFLISLKAGGVALNLTEASRVFICDPWWNPAAELQAMDRIHRLGQKRPIKITRLVIENSIESRIVQLQEKKTALVDSTLGKDTSALEQLSVEDLRFLFVL